MILVFGGTTEGKRTAEILDFINEPYFYSTKIKVRFEMKGKTIAGEMDSQKIIDFCIKRDVVLIIDAAHPFASRLHQNIYNASQHLKIPVLRYEREYSERSAHKNVVFFDSYQALSQAILKSKFQTILSLTGVQTIPILSEVWKNRSCFFRILNTDLSRQKAQEFGIDNAYVIPMDPSGDVDELLLLTKKTKAQIMLSKESGTSGFMESKFQVAQRLNIPLWIVKRPTLPDYDFTVCGEKELLQQIYVLRKSVLKIDGELRSGFTTGTCVTAAVKACFLAFTQGEFPKSVEVFLPDGERTKLLVFPEYLLEKQAACSVIKNGGDDPDVTHGKEIGCALTLSEKSGIRFLQGKGIGKVTLPGLSLPVGEPAINPIPRKMISEMLGCLAGEYGIDTGFDVRPFVPEGEELAKQTFNRRVGVLGGISIIGTTGKVNPYSNEAFLATIKYQISVAHKSGCDEILLTSGKRSENSLRLQFPQLPDTAFIHFGNLVGDTIKMATEQGVKKTNLALMFGKAVKLAEGNLNTHSKNICFNAAFLGKLASDCGYVKDVITQVEKLQMANAIFYILPIKKNESFYRRIAEICFFVCKPLIRQDHSFSFILLLDEGINIHVKM